MIIKPSTLSLCFAGEKPFAGDYQDFCFELAFLGEQYIWPVLTKTPNLRLHFAGEKPFACDN